MSNSHRRSAYTQSGGCTVNIIIILFYKLNLIFTFWKFILVNCSSESFLHKIYKFSIYILLKFSWSSFHYPKILDFKLFQYFNQFLKTFHYRITFQDNVQKRLRDFPYEVTSSVTPCIITARGLMKQLFNCCWRELFNNLHPKHYFLGVHISYLHPKYIMYSYLYM